MRVEFTVPGNCVAKARPRFSNKTGRVFTPNNTHKYEKLVKECYGDNYYFDNKSKIVEKSRKFVYNVCEVKDHGKTNNMSSRKT